MFCHFFKILLTSSFFWSSLNSDLNNMNLVKKKFYSNFQSLKDKYPNQTANFWNNIESSFCYSIIDSGSPSILLLVNDKSTSNVANRIKSDMLEFFSLVLSYVPEIRTNELVIDPLSGELAFLLKNEKFDAAKKYVDTRLEVIFGSGKRVALVQNIERLPFSTMVLFYTYGDDIINAKYPGTIIIFTLELSSEFNLKSLERKKILQSCSQLTVLVENYLTDLYSANVHEDQLKPLFTRIANNIIFINEEIN